MLSRQATKGRCHGDHAGVAESSICACKTDNETVEHVLFRCANHDHCRTQLMDVVDNIWISATAKNFVYSKAHMLIAPIILEQIIINNNNNSRSLMVSAGYARIQFL